MEADTGISIHALLAESDRPQPPQGESSIKFLSTLSLRRATAVIRRAVWAYFISIHALLAESDCYSLRHSAQDRHFYPRSPCGERPDGSSGRQEEKQISIHALLAESDDEIPYQRQIDQFLSTLSLRRATAFIHSKHS